VIFFYLISAYREREYENDGELMNNLEEMDESNEGVSVISFVIVVLYHVTFKVVLYPGCHECVIDTLAD